jgi:hypothetical protein
MRIPHEFIMLNRFSGLPPENGCELEAKHVCSIFQTCHELATFRFAANNYCCWDQVRQMTDNEKAWSVLERHPFPAL